MSDQIFKNLIIRKRWNFTNTIMQKKKIDSQIVGLLRILNMDIPRQGVSLDNFEYISKVPFLWSLSNFEKNNSYVLWFLNVLTFFFTEPFNWLMGWYGAISFHHMISLLDKHFFPKWLQVLRQWLTNTPNFDEVTKWYVMIE